MTMANRASPGSLLAARTRVPSVDLRVSQHTVPAGRSTPIGTVTGMNDERKQGQP
jgi:hypothetical protein